VHGTAVAARVALNTREAATLEQVDREDPMEREEALSALREVAVDVLSVEPDDVVETARFKEDLDADSLDLVELVMGLEERFDISVPEEDLESVATVGQAVDLVMSKVEAKE
jgi:acyl carrier protein